MRRGKLRYTGGTRGERLRKRFDDRIAARQLARKRRCNVQREKIVKYLLNLKHPKGAAKAKFFIGGGFSPQQPEVLEAALIQHYQDNKPTELFKDQFGSIRIVIDAPMKVPDGRAPRVRTVWQILQGESTARFITAIPD